MAARTESIRLLDAEENIEYVIDVSPEDAFKAKNDNIFATRLLVQAKKYAAAAKAQASITEPEENEPLGDLRNSDTLQEKAPANNTNEQHLWSRVETLALIELYQKYQLDFTNGKISVKRAWENLAVRLMEKNISISGEKCSIKFQALKRQYKKVVDNNNKSGNGALPKWEYYTAMHEIFYKKPWVQPLAEAGTSTQADANEGHNKENVADPKSRKRKADTVNAVTDYLRDLSEQRERNREDKNRRHEEKMARLDKLTNLMEQFLKK